MPAIGLAALTALASPACSAETVTASSTIVSDYVFRGLRLGGASLQPGVELSSGNSVAGITGSVPLEHATSMQPEAEFDLYASHHFAVTPQVQTLIGVAAYIYRDAPATAGFRRHVFEPNIGLSYTIAGVRLNSTFHYDITRKGPTFELSAAVALPLPHLGTEIDFTATAGTYRLHDSSRAPGPGTKFSGAYWVVDAGMPFQVSVRSKITVGVAYSVSDESYINSGGALRRDHLLAGRRFAVSFGYAYAF